MKRVLRLAHLTDVHVTHERSTAEGLAACLRHMQALDDRPDLILQGGDAIMDAMAASAQHAQQQADIWHRVLAAELDPKLPTIHCVGNHDVWGLERERAGCNGAEPLFGKAFALQLLKLEKAYYSFDRSGWHFVVLDSTYPLANGYTARLDDEQFEWLQRDLAQVRAGVPVLVLSHIPILSAAAYFDGDNETTGDWHVPGAWMHIDARRIKDLFARRGNVQLCLSGHLHLVDRCDYLGVSYVCNGAVCGAWWKGDCQEFPPGYGLVDLFDDGSFTVAYQTFGWRPPAAALASMP